MSSPATNQPPPNLDTEIQPFKSLKEKEKYESLANLYSILLCVEHLEKAYIRDIIAPEEYDKECQRYIKQFRAANNELEATNNSGNSGNVTSSGTGAGVAGSTGNPLAAVQGFIKEWKLNFPAAFRRLLEVGVPATVEFGVKNPASETRAGDVAETVQHLITLMDSLRLNMVSVDQIHPLLSEVMQTLSKVTNPEFEPRNKIRDWLVTLNMMRAVDELAEGQVRQLLFDLEATHVAFMRELKDGK